MIIFETNKLLMGDNLRMFLFALNMLENFIVGSLLEQGKTKINKSILSGNVIFFHFFVIHILIPFAK